LLLTVYYKVGDMYKSDMRQLDSEAWQQIHEHKWYSIQDFFIQQLIVPWYLEVHWNLF